MEIQTKVFLINWIILVAFAFIDRHVLNDITDDTIWSYFLGLWALISWISIPVFLIWLIIK